MGNNNCCCRKATPTFAEGSAQTQQVQYEKKYFECYINKE